MGVRLITQGVFAGSLRLSGVRRGCSATRPKALPPVFRTTVWWRPPGPTVKSLIRDYDTYWSSYRMCSRWRTMQHCCRSELINRDTTLNLNLIVGWWIVSYASGTFRCPLMCRQIHQARNRLGKFLGPPKPLNSESYPGTKNRPPPGTGPKRLT